MRTKLLQNIVVPEVAIAADGVQNYELAVNPLSVVLLTLRPLNDTGTLSDYNRYMALCQAVNRVSVVYNGQSIISMRGEDVAAFNYLRWGILPELANSDNVNNERLAVVLPLILGARPMDKDSCFPATTRGQLTMEIDFDIADTGYDGLRFSAETIEILGAKPKEFERRVQVSQTFGATGQNDIDLVPGNLCRGILFWGTTPWGGATPASTFGRFKVLLDNMEAGYASTDWEVQKAMPYIFGGRAVSLGNDHKHTLDATVAGVTETTSVCDVGNDLANYVYLDYDPTRDDEYTLDTKGARRFNVRTEAEAAEAVRVVQVEVIKTNELAG